MTNKKAKLTLGLCSICGREDNLRNGVCYRCWFERTHLPTVYFYFNRKERPSGGTQK